MNKYLAVRRVIREWWPDVAVGLLVAIVGYVLLFKI
jgi:hypothetical protein